MSFAVAESICGIGLHQIVDSGRATADGSLGDLEKFESGDLLEQTAGLEAHTLRVLQVARIVEGYAQRQKISSGTRLEFRKDFADVFAFRGEDFCAISGQASQIQFPAC